MLTLSIENFHVELTEGSIENVGAPDKAGTAKLYDVEELSVREFGDQRVKLAFADGEGNEVEVALAPEHASEVARGVESLDGESRVFE